MAARSAFSHLTHERSRSRGIFAQVSGHPPNWFTRSTISTIRSASVCAPCVTSRNPAAAIRVRRRRRRESAKYDSFPSSGCEIELRFDLP